MLWLNILKSALVEGSAVSVWVLWAQKHGLLLLSASYFERDCET